MLAQLRRTAGLSQAQVAARIEGLRRSQNLGDWERERAKPHPRFIPALAAVFDVDPLLLLDVEVDDPPLEALRLRAGLSQLDVQHRTGMFSTTYARLENGSRRGDLDPVLARLLADAFAVTPEALLRAVKRSRRP